MAIAVLMLGVVEFLAADEAWVLWTRSFSGDRRDVPEAAWFRSEAFPDYQSCLQEQDRRHKENLAWQCTNVLTGAVIPSCQAVSADGLTGIKIRNKNGSLLFIYRTCWPASVDPRH